MNSFLSSRKPAPRSSCASSRTHLHRNGVSLSQVRRARKRHRGRKSPKLQPKETHKSRPIPRNLTTKMVSRTIWRLVVGRFHCECASSIPALCRRGSGTCYALQGRRSLAVAHKSSPPKSARRSSPLSAPKPGAPRNVPIRRPDRVRPEPPRNSAISHSGWKTTRTSRCQRCSERCRMSRDFASYLRRCRKTGSTFWPGSIT